MNSNNKPVRFFVKTAQAGDAIRATGETFGGAAELSVNFIALMFATAAGAGALSGYLAQKMTSPSADSARSLQKEVYSWKQEDALARGREEFEHQKHQRARQLAAPKRGVMWR
jgi:hypothetical protein